jgi:hypothetical protein
MENTSRKESRAKMTTTQAKATAKQVAPIDSAYFAEEDVMALQSKLIEKNYIDLEPDENDPLVDPVFLAKALDRLVDTIKADMLEFPEDILFGTCDGNHRRDFERAIRYVAG